MSKSMLDYALEYAAAGIPVIPLHTADAKGRCSCDRPEGRCTPGKHPRISEWQKRATTDANTIEKWWGKRRWPNASIGGVCGTYLCLDVDPKHDGPDSFDRLIEGNAKLPKTAVARTGKHGKERGTHYWFLVPEGYQPGTRANVREGIDIRCVGGYAVLPPSPHPSGVNYEWVRGSTFDKIVEAPEWLCELTPEYVQGDAAWTPNRSVPMSKAVRQFLNGELEIEIGEQRQFLCRAARSVLTQGRNVETTTQILWEGFNGDGGISNCDYDPDQGPWMPEHIYELVSSEYDHPPSTPLEKDFTQQFTFDDAGNAKRLIASFPPGAIHWAPAHDAWYIWDNDDNRYFRDGGSWMRTRFMAVIDEFATTAQAATTEDGARQIYGHATRSRMRPKIVAATELAHDLAKIPEHEIDTDPMMFQAGNGVIDLRDGEIREQKPEDNLMRGSSIEYDPDARSSLFEDFLERTVPDEQLREYLQVAAGYSITGRTDEHAFFYLYGLPATGKSTFLEALKHICGTYAMTAMPTTITSSADRSGSGPTEDLARLAGARLVSVSEVPPGAHLSTGLVSTLVSGEKVTARHLHASSFEFLPRMKLWIGANHLPKVAGASRSGIWRRVKVVPFNEQIPADELDRRLSMKLREPEAAAAILAWAVDGAIRWWEKFSAEGSGIPESTAVEESVSEYKIESDHVAAFAQEALATVPDAVGSRIGVGELFDHYNAWCDAEGRQQRYTQHKLSRQLADLGFIARNAKLNGKVARCWVGLELVGEFKSTKQSSGGGINVKGATKRKREHSGRTRK